MAFQRGNKKLGPKIWTFSIPAGDSCPGKTEKCANDCYAASGFFLMPSVAKSLEGNWSDAKRPGFVNWAIGEIKRINVKVLRVHVAGDIYSAGYAAKWLKIIKSSPQCRFFIYTRSWRIPKISKVLTQIAKLKNVRLWYSVDSESGKPSRVPNNVRLAYMQTETTDIPNYDIDLVFRTDNLRGLIAKKVNGTMVCPTENGVTRDMTCTKCGYCYRDIGEHIEWSDRRIELTVI